MTSSDTHIHEILFQYWGYKEFRPLQKEIIFSVLNGNDTLALLPTGGGKSICFQVPAIALGGTCIVISPLIALMNDQVQNLRLKGISAVALSSAMSFKEIDIVLNNAAFGHVKFLYVSPERLESEDFRKRLSFLPITLIAVDEAHCISQWGYDFRPSYLNINNIKPYFEKVPIIAVTASATDNVVADIQAKLNFKKNKVFKQSFARKNLRYIVQKEDNKFERIIKLIKNIGGSGVLYVRNRKRTEDIAKFLLSNKISAIAYHAGLTFEKRSEIQKNWVENKTQVICATNAFGMGIDKPDVRFVIHFDIPDSIEAYFQEAGRGGRDLKTAYASLFYTDADIEKLKENVKISFPEIEKIKQCYKAICNYYQIAVDTGKGLSFDFEIERISQSYNISSLLLFNAIKFLEKENCLAYLDLGYEPSKLMILSDKQALYEFQVRSEKHEALIKAILRTYGGIFDNYVPINEKELAYRSKVGELKVIEQLNFLNKQGVIEYVPKSKIPKIVFTQNRIDHNHLRISEENYHKLKQEYERKINAIINYCANDKVCRNIQLLQYFGEQDYSKCGFCDVCIKQKSFNNSAVKQKLLSVFKNRKATAVDLKNAMLAFNTETWVNALNELIEDGTLLHKDDEYFLI
ncbi:MAG: RecQ family ATP-dependent DNA helicase [Bacteroidetes bacterium]|nr:RecQ family ATP-dependent DNA helicase [Bacteroidota bacterium]